MRAITVLLLVQFALAITLVTAATTQMKNNEIFGYDLHVYFFGNNNASKVSAEGLMKQAQSLWPNLTTKIFYTPVGPHTMPMFEIDIPTSARALDSIVPWIMQNHGAHSTLLHPHSGDELRDHTECPFWLGERVPLDLSKL